MGPRVPLGCSFHVACFVDGTGILHLWRNLSLADQVAGVACLSSCPERGVLVILCVFGYHVINLNGLVEAERKWIVTDAAPALRRRYH